MTHAIRRTATFLVLLLCSTACARASDAKTEPKPQVKTRTPLGLDGYTLKAGPILIEGIKKNASGITYNPDDKILLLVTNKPKRAFEITAEGKNLREILLSGFSDTEGITYLGDGKYAVIEEKRRTVCILPISKDTKKVKRSQGKLALIDPVAAGNAGLEGVAYDPATKCLYLAKELNPKKIYKITRDNVEKGKAEVTNPWDAEKDALKLKDISDLHWHAPSGHLLVLSHESACLVECTPNGKEVSRLSLSAGSAGLKKTIPQAEGVTVDSQGTLYICSEPRTLYVFTKKKSEKKDAEK